MKGIKCNTHRVELPCRPVQLSYPVSPFAEAASELCHQPAVSAFPLPLAVFAASELPSAASACQLLLAVSAASACQLPLAVSAASGLALQSLSSGL